MTILQLHESVTRMVGLADSPRDGLALLTDEHSVALSVLAAPEAIAVVTRRDPGGVVIHVIATRGPWLAEHVIEGDTHHMRTGDADYAALVLLDRTGFTEPGVDVSLALTRDVDVTLSDFRRMHELTLGGDRRRARACLVAAGAATNDAHALVDAVAAGRVDVAGLAVDGRRFVGCDLAVVGDGVSGRWLVPPVLHVGVGPTDVIRHPSYGGPRALIERADPDALRDELSLIFGEV